MTKHTASDFAPPVMYIRVARGCENLTTAPLEVDWRRQYDDLDAETEGAEALTDPSSMVLDAGGDDLTEAKIVDLIKLALALDTAPVLRKP